MLLNFLSTPNQNASTQCSLKETTECELTKQADHMSVQFLQNIELEEELKLRITANKNLKIEKMWVQGVNMFMGKTAVLIDSSYQGSNDIIHDATLFLGACSEPNMKWQLVIQTANSEQTKQSWFFNFATDRK